MGRVAHSMSTSWSIKSFCQMGDISGREREFLANGNISPWILLSRMVQETKGRFCPSPTSVDTRYPHHLLAGAHCFFLEEPGPILGTLDWYKLSPRVRMTLISRYWGRSNVSHGWIFHWHFAFLHSTLKEITHITWYPCSHKPPASWTCSLIKVTNLEPMKMNQLIEPSGFSPGST